MGGKQTMQARLDVGLPARLFSRLIKVPELATNMQGCGSSNQTGVCVNTRGERLDFSFLKSFWSLNFVAAAFAASANEDRPMSGSQFEVEGSITYSVAARRGQPTRETSSTFVISVNDCKWFVRISNPTKTEFDYREISYDGRQLYYVESFPTRIRLKQERGEAVGFNEATAWMYKGETFHDEFAHEVGPLWICYASGCFFTNLRTNEMEPVITFGVSTGVYSSTANPFLQRIQREMQPKFPKLPVRVVFLDDGLLRISKGVTVRREKLFADGFTNAVFEVLRQTNLAGALFPAESRLRVYAPEPFGPNPTNLALFSEYLIRLTSGTRTSSVTNFQPSLPQKTYLSDARFAEARPIGMISTGQWPSEDFVKQGKQYEQAVRVERHSSPVVSENSNRKVFVVRCVAILFLTTSFLAGGLLLWKRFGKPILKNERIDP